MNEIEILNRQLPESISDLATYDKYYSARQPVYRKLLHSVKEWKEASEEEKRILKRAQDEADYLIDIRVKIGEITARIPKASGGDRRSEDFKNDNMVDFEKPKSATLSEMGISQKQAERYETLSKHPEVVERAKAEARESNELVTQTQILKEIQKPHVANNSKDDEWYTPPQYIESARSVMGSIDLDPASNDFANETVKAGTYYTEADNGLEKEWFGNVWLNPPYSASLVQLFADKVANSDFEQAIVLVNNATETAWFRKLIEKASAIIFTTGRIKYRKRDGEHGSPLQGQAFLYFGENVEAFLSEFRTYGWGCRL